MHEDMDLAVGHTFVMHFLPEGGVQVRQVCAQILCSWEARGARSWQHGSACGRASISCASAKQVANWFPTCPGSLDATRNACLCSERCYSIQAAPVVPGGCCWQQVYQCLIRHFRLHTYLQSHGPLDAAGLQTFIDNLEVIAGAGDTWGPAEDAAYESNFLVSLAGTTGKMSVGRARLASGPDLDLSASARAQPLKADHKPRAVSSVGAAAFAAEFNSIHVRMQLECLVVPWTDPAGKNMTDVTGRRVKLPLVAGDPAAADLLPTVQKHLSDSL